MSISFRAWSAAIAAAAIAVAAPGLASAADLGEGPPRGSMKDDFEPSVAPSLKYYAALRGAFVFPSDTDFDIGDGATNVVNTYDDLAYSVNGALGMQLYETAGYVLRGELELGYRASEVDVHELNGTPNDDSFGDTNVFFGLANLVLDFKTGTAFRPYVSAGGGFGHVDLDGHGVGADTVMDDSSTGYAFQLGAGFSYAISQNLSFEAGYRYFSVIETEFTAEDGTTSDVDVEDHQILLGLRHKF